jgi:hypothetical protein
MDNNSNECFLIFDSNKLSGFSDYNNRKIFFEILQKQYIKCLELKKESIDSNYILMCDCVINRLIKHYEHINNENSDFRQITHMIKQLINLIKLIK